MPLSENSVARPGQEAAAHEKTLAEGAHTPAVDQGREGQHNASITDFSFLQNRTANEKPPSSQPYIHMLRPGLTPGVLNGSGPNQLSANVLGGKNGTTDGEPTPARYSITGGERQPQTPNSSIGRRQIA